MGLVAAVRAGDLPAVRALLKSGADSNSRGEDERTALYHAAAAGHAGIADALLAAGAEPNVRCPGAFPSTPLTLAAEAGALEILCLLLSAGADPDTADDEGYTPLMHAAWRQHREEARVLLDAGARSDERAHAYLSLLQFEETSRQPAYQAVAQHLSEACACAPRPVEGQPGVLRFWVSDPEALAQRWAAAHPSPQAGAAPEGIPLGELLDRMGEHVRACGFHLLYPAHWSPGREATLVLLPTDDKYAAVAAMRTQGAGYRLSNADIIAWMRVLDAERPFVLTRCCHDAVEGRFISPVQDPAALARRMVGFCPDLEDAVAVAGRLRASGRFRLWWD